MTNINDFINQVYNCDVMELLKQLPDKSVSMVYGDPDYNVNYHYGIDRNKNYTKPFIEYIDWYINLAMECRRIIKDDGNMFWINYPKNNAYLHVYLDKHCYSIEDYAWCYNSMQGISNKKFTTAHRSILHCRITKENKWYNENVAVPYENPKDARIKKRIAEGSKGRAPYDWFIINIVKNVSDEKSIHSCVIPAQLFTMLLKASTQKGDTVLVLFAGSGGELEICKLLGRNFISSEIDPDYHKMVTDRLSSGIIDSKYRPNNKPATCINKLAYTTKERTIDDF